MCSCVCLWGRVGAKNLEKQRVKMCGCLSLERGGFMTANCEEEDGLAFCYMCVFVCVCIVAYVYVCVSVRVFQTCFITATLVSLILACCLTSFKWSKSMRTRIFLKRFQSVAFGFFLFWR